MSPREGALLKVPAVAWQDLWPPGAVVKFAASLS